MIKATVTGTLILFLSLGSCAGAKARCAADDNAPLKLIVCEPHHRVLYHWLVEAEQGALPKKGVTVIHFDAHPDMALPSHPIRSDWPEDIDQIPFPTDYRYVVSIAARRRSHHGRTSVVETRKPNTQ